jgi:mono/diheme cytochrome c family protein
MKEREWRSKRRHPLIALAVLVGLTMFVGCDRLDMYDQPRYKPLAESDFFADGLSARPQVEGTVARGMLRDDELLYTGKESGKFSNQIPQAVYQSVYDRDPRRFDRPLDQTEPAELRRALMTRGRERFNIHCSVCHGRTGDGDGMIVRRGFRKPPTLHIDRLRNAPAGYFFDVITNGFGAMPSYANRIDVFDRWAIVTYVRALQFSQAAQLADVPDDERHWLSRSSSSPLDEQP